MTERRSSVQMVMLTAPEPRKAAAFYVEHLGFRMLDAEDDEESTVEGFGMHVVIERGAGGAHTSPPARERVVAEIPSTTARIDAVWDRDREQHPDVAGPMLEASGSFVYVTVDPAGNAIALVAPLPTDASMTADRVTQRIERPKL